MSKDDETVGDIEDLHQQEPEDYNIKAVPVNVEGPVKVQSLPARTSSMQSFTVGVTPEIILSDDPRRARAVVLPTDGDVYLGATSSDCSNGRGFLLLDPIPLDIFHQNVVWVCAAAETVVLSVLVENWAD